MVHISLVFYVCALCLFSRVATGRYDGMRGVKWQPCLPVQSGSSISLFGKKWLNVVNPTINLYHLGMALHPIQFYDHVGDGL